MGKKVTIATLAGFFAMFLLGWLVFGILLKDQMASVYAGSGGNPEPGMFHIILATLVQALLYALILYKFGSTTFMSGLISAAWVSFLFTLVNAIWFDTTFSWYSLGSTGVFELLTGTITAAIMGGVIGWTLGKVK